MGTQRKRAAPLPRREPQSNAQSCAEHSTKNSPEVQPKARLTEVLLVEIRCGSMRARLAQYDMDSVGTALSHGLINAEQAMAELYDRDALHWMFLEGAQ